jgi:hypothetical protein
MMVVDYLVKMDTYTIPYIQPPDQLADGFLAYAQSVYQEAQDRNELFSKGEFTAKINNDFSGKVRFHFLLWVMDLNKIIDGINIILSDMTDLVADRNTFKGDPVIRTELLMVAFFGEFVRLREISKIYFKVFYKAGVLREQTKKVFVDAYYNVFNQFYEIRNQFVHQGLSFADYDVNFNWSVFDDLPEEVRDKFIALLKQSNTKENTVKIQCAIYLKVITSIMGSYIKLQDKLNEELAKIIIAYEEIFLKPDTAGNKTTTIL